MSAYMMPTVVRNAQTGHTKAQESDHQTAGTLSILMPHYEVHKGKYFRVEFVFEELAALASGLLLIRVAPHECIHIRFQVYTPSSPWALMLCEGPTYDDAGVRRWPVNKNREVGGSSCAEFYIDPVNATCGGEGELCTQVGNASVVTDACNMRLETGEWILARGHDYLVEVFNQDAQAAREVWVFMEFYEEPWRDPNDPSRS